MDQGRESVRLAMAQRPVLWSQWLLGLTWPTVVLWGIAASALLLGQPTPQSLLIGLVVSVAGEALRIITAGYGYRLGELSVRGPYRFVRHPYFLGTALFHIGMWLAAREVYIIGIGMALMCIVNQRALAHDEERLRRHLGPRYVEYLVAVPSFLPRLWPVAAGDLDERRFSLRTAVLTGRHHELPALLWLLGFYGCSALAANQLLGDWLRPLLALLLGILVVGRLVQRVRLIRGGAPLGVAKQG